MKRGFTFIEILIAISILVLISTIVLTSVRVYVQSQALSGAAVSVAGLLADARTRTLSGNGGEHYGVHFEADAVTLFLGTSYSAGAVGNEVTLLDERVTLSDISLGGGSDVVFEKLTGGTDDAGTVTVELVSDASRQKVITIQGTGLISYE